MSIGSRDFEGAAGFLAGLRGLSSGDSARQEAEAEADPIAPEDLLERLGRASAVTTGELTGIFGDKAEAIIRQIDELVERGWVERRTEAAGETYALSERGRRILKLARITQSGS